MHQNEQTLQRGVHREAVHVDVAGAASTVLVQALEYNWNRSARSRVSFESVSKVRSEKVLFGLTALRTPIEYKHHFRPRVPVLDGQEGLDRAAGLFLLQPDVGQRDDELVLVPHILQTRGETYLGKSAENVRRRRNVDDVI